MHADLKLFLNVLQQGRIPIIAVQGDVQRHCRHWSRCVVQPFGSPIRQRRHDGAIARAYIRLGTQHAAQRGRPSLGTDHEARKHHERSDARDHGGGRDRECDGLRARDRIVGHARHCDGDLARAVSHKGALREQQRPHDVVPTALVVPCRHDRPEQHACR